MALAEAIVGHLVGDYLFQNDWQAQGKKRSTAICAVHCLLWTASVCAFAGWYDLLPAVVLFVSHFAQDRTGFVRWWMGLVGQEAFATGVLSPWSIIVVDNVMHILAIYAVAKFLV